jgi:hypothetical protein
MSAYNSAQVPANKYKLEMLVDGYSSGRYWRRVVKVRPEEALDQAARRYGKKGVVAVAFPEFRWACKKNITVRRGEVLVA